MTYFVPDSKQVLVDWLSGRNRDSMSALLDRSAVLLVRAIELAVWRFARKRSTDSLDSTDSAANTRMGWLFSDFKVTYV